MIFTITKGKKGIYFIHIYWLYTNLKIISIFFVFKFSFCEFMKKHYPLSAGPMKCRIDGAFKFFLKINKKKLNHTKNK